MFRSQTYHRGSHLPVVVLLRPLVSLLLLIIAFSYSQPSFAQNTTKEYLDCYRPKPFSCGDVETEIKYPFWTNDQPEYCGHPGYNLTCSGDDNNKKTLSMKIGGKTYRVRQRIDYEGQVLDLIDADLFVELTTSTNSCPKEISNTTGLESSSLTYLSNDINLTLFLNCNPNFSLPDIELLPITYCSNDFFGQTSFFTLQREAITVLDVSAFCASTVSVPVYDQFNQNDFITGGKTTFLDALKVGFGLRWTVGQNWCGECTKGSGLCGYNVSHPNEPACFCPANTTSTGFSCTPSTNGGKKKTGIIIGGVLGGLVAGIFMVCCLWWFCSRRKRQQRSSSTLLGRASPSDPSSMKDPEYGSTNYLTHIFRYQELEEATSNFAEANELGDGGFGTVYKGILQDGRTVAVKRLYENNYKRVEQFANEILILSRLRHTNLVILYGCTSRHSRELLLVYEFVPNGTVADHLHGPRAHEGSLTWPVRMSIAIETADALAYLHAVEPQIIHRDVKTNNILLDNNFHVKVADFGLSRLFPAHVTHVSTAPQGTPGYVDPEYHQCYQLTEKSDVYSFGVVLVELISSKPAVDITRHRHEINLANMAINKIQNSELDELIDPALGYETDYGVKRMITLVAELAFRCLQGDGDLRPTIREALEVLREIERGGSKAAEDDIPMRDDAGLLKSLTPDSPDTVMDKWSSKDTTPNTSK